MPDIPPGSDATKSLRLFTAIPVPEAAFREIRKALSGRGDILERLPSRLHVTLRFMGNVPASLLPEVREALLTASGPPPFSLELGPLGVFRRREDTVLWAGLKPSEELSALKARVDAALA
ncbi:MAG: 2'-5' RNA ligase family protein, partial [Deltaproteobacteria bacterium]|nr:2'-5' RNA ligase family protein [Deltaproteobacteria bacterium]